MVQVTSLRLSPDVSFHWADISARIHLGLGANFQSIAAHFQLPCLPVMCHLATQLKKVGRSYRGAFGSILSEAPNCVTNPTITSSPANIAAFTSTV